MLEADKYFNSRQCKANIILLSFVTLVLHWHFLHIVCPQRLRVGISPVSVCTDVRICNRHCWLTFNQHHACLCECSCVCVCVRNGTPDIRILLASLSSQLHSQKPILPKQAKYHFKVEDKSFMQLLSGLSVV